MAGRRSKDAFGLTKAAEEDPNSPSDEEFFSPDNDQAPEGAALAQENPPVPASATVEEPPPVTPAAPAPAQAEEAPTEEPAGFTFAGRSFADQAMAEQSYTAMQAWQQRVDQENAQLTQRMAQYDQMWQQALPLLQSMEQGQAPQPQPSVQGPAQAQPSQQVQLQPVPNFDENPAEYIAATVNNALAQQRQELLGPLQQQQQGWMNQQQQWQQQQAQAQQEQARDQVVTQNLAAFRAAHPEVAPQSGADLLVGTALRQANLDAADPQQLEFAYELVQQPRIMDVLATSPHFAYTPQGRAMARAMAQMVAPGPGNGQAPGAPGANARPTPPGAVTETGGSGAPLSPAPTSQQGPRDEFSDVMDLAEKLKDPAQTDIFHR